MSTATNKSYCPGTPGGNALFSFPGLIHHICIYLQNLYTMLQNKFRTDEFHFAHLAAEQGCLFLLGDFLR